MQGLFHQAILGDLNTMAHGLARLSPKYCCDKMRFWTIGRPEALFWHRNLITVPDTNFLPDGDWQSTGLQLTQACNILPCYTEIYESQNLIRGCTDAFVCFLLQVKWR